MSWLSSSPSRPYWPEGWSNRRLIEGDIPPRTDAVPTEGLLLVPSRHHSPRVATGAQAHGSAAIAAEFQPLLAHIEPPVGTHLLHGHGAGLPRSPGQAALQGDAHGLGSCRRQGECHGKQKGEARVHGLAGRAYLQPDQGQGRVGLGLPRFNNPRGAQVPVFSARVLVSLRPSVLDPAGEATRAAAARLGVQGVTKLRIGKAVELEIEAADAASARQQLELLSDRLLANPVIENWTLELQDTAAQEA